MVLDIQDFIEERGGNPNKIRESQRRRHAPESVVDDIIAMFEDHRRSEASFAPDSESLNGTLIFIANYGATQIGAQINTTQKEIGAKKKVRIRCRPGV